jgi:agmatine deiminase
MATPREDGFAMPAEFAPHERTIMGWPTRRELWTSELGQAKVDYAAVANAIAAFEPVTMVASPGDVDEARAALDGNVEVVGEPIDDSWLRDNGPIFLLSRDGASRRATLFDFNAWGEKFTPYDKDAALAAKLCAMWVVETYEAGMVLEGGSVHVDGAGLAVTTEQCLLHHSRNPWMAQEQIEARVLAYLGATEMLWLGQGLIEDRDTDGHVDLIFAFTGPRAAVIQTVPEENHNFPNCMENVQRARAAGLSVIEFPHLAYGEVAGEPTAMSYLNLYLCNGAAIVPTSGGPEDEAALAQLGEVFPEREIVPVPGLVLAYGGGGPHCITQQVPAVRAG